MRDEPLNLSSSTISKQDFVAVTETAKNKIIERLVTKYDVQAAADSARDRILAAIQSLHDENQAIMRSNNAQSDQLSSRINALEAQITSLQQEVRAFNQFMEQSDAMYGQQVRPRSG